MRVDGFGGHTTAGVCFFLFVERPQPRSDRSRAAPSEFFDTGYAQKVLIHNSSFTRYIVLTTLDRP